MTIILLKILCWIQRWKHVENRLTFGKVMSEKCRWSFLTHNVERCGFWSSDLLNLLNFRLMKRLLSYTALSRAAASTSSSCFFVPVLLPDQFSLIFMNVSNSTGPNPPICHPWNNSCCSIKVLLGTTHINICTVCILLQHPLYIDVSAKTC